MNADGPIVAYVHDLFFSAKIRETARALGLAVVTARAPSDAEALAPTARLVVVDLRRPGAFELLMCLDGRQDAPPRVGFVDHGATDLLTRARSLGCRALARSKFTSDLPLLLQGAPVEAPLDDEG